MSVNKVIIALGSNIMPVINMGIAIEHLRKQFRFISVSSFETTKPLGITDQPDFLNVAVMVETDLHQSKVESILKQIEDTMGRDRTLPKFGPRVIDLDVIIWNNEVVDDDYYSRDFLQRAVKQINEYINDRADDV